MILLFALTADVPQRRRVRDTGDGRPDGPVHAGSVIFAKNDAYLQIMELGDVGYSTCASGQEYTGEELPVGDLLKGTSVCVKTTAQRYARLVLVEEANGEEARFKATVWER